MVKKIRLHAPLPYQSGAVPWDVMNVAESLVGQEMALEVAVTTLSSALNREGDRISSNEICIIYNDGFSASLLMRYELVA